MAPPPAVVFGLPAGTRADMHPSPTGVVHHSGRGLSLRSAEASYPLARDLVRIAMSDKPSRTPLQVCIPGKVSLHAFREGMHRLPVLSSGTSLTGLERGFRGPRRRTILRSSGEHARSPVRSCFPPSRSCDAPTVSTTAWFPRVALASRRERRMRSGVAATAYCSGGTSGDALRGGGGPEHHRRRCTDRKRSANRGASAQTRLAVCGGTRF